MQVLVAARRSGAVDVNLTCANFVFMMEPGLNHALDAQAVGRAWRMGQTREVNVRRLFIKNTVEVPLSSSRHLRTCLQAVTLHMDQRLRGGNPDWAYVSAYSHVSPASSTAVSQLLNSDQRHTREVQASAREASPASGPAPQQSPGVLQEYMMEVFQGRQNAQRGSSSMEASGNAGHSSDARRISSQMKLGVEEMLKLFAAPKR